MISGGLCDPIVPFHSFHVSLLVFDHVMLVEVVLDVMSIESAG